LKVFASYKPIDLTPLTQGQIRAIGEEATDPLQGLLDDSSDGTRAVTVVLSKPADLGTWGTAQRVLVVRRK
jgi:hypothetical protein